MDKLKRFLESSEIVVNENIVAVQKEIDELFKKHLKDPLGNNRVLMEVKCNTKNYYYGYLGAIKNISEKIKEIEELDMIEFELALDELNITERELKADA